ncbi:MAG: 3-phosphoglycerate dehydrogenase [Lachnospiraceae bacterium]|nr:3-phosphoglycerate dehydrogenase [Lachnospiraceae bacterium]
MKYITLNPIAAAGLNALPADFVKTDDIKEANAVLVRSASMLDMDFSENLEAIGRAGAGVNNIPVERCADKGIVVFNTPGANANGVKELVVLGLILAARDAKGGMAWVDANLDDENISKSMEKAKSKFAGTEIQGKTLGVIGLGAIGVLVANAAIGLKMRVIGHDPYISVHNALMMSRSVELTNSIDELYAQADYVTIHVPETPDTKGYINAYAISKMKDGAALLNFARDGLVVTADVKAALESGKLRKYVTDVPNHEIVNTKNVIAFPHLGASTEESETNCAIMAAQELSDFLLNGNITNSVNYPAVTLGKAVKPVRICVAHRNVPNVISTLTALLGSAKANISDMVSKSRGNYAWSMFDMDHDIKEATIAAIRAIPEVIRVKVIRN